MGTPCYDMRYVHGSTHILYGPSGSGKTYRIAAILRMKNDIIRGGENIKNVVFCYSSWQPLYDQLKSEGVVTKWVQKMPSNGEYMDLVQGHATRGGSIVILDDFMTEINKDMVEIVTVSSRHTNTSTFILFQSLFPSNPLARQLSLNAKYIHINKNPRENAQIQYLARQIQPSNYKWIVQAYHEATKEPFSTFQINMRQETPDHLRYLSNTLPNQFPIRVWTAKGGII